MAGGGGTHGTQEPESVLVSAVVRVRGPDGAIGGTGFLVAPDLVLTCAHVVSDALDLPRDAEVPAGAEVTVDLPLADGTGNPGPPGRAEVQHWVPIRTDQTGDVSLLRLRAALPGARPLPMADAESVWDHKARVVGFTHDHPDGVWTLGRLRGPTGRGWVQLSRADGQTAHVQGGFSGSPVWDDDLGSAVGLVVAAQPVREAQQVFVTRTRALIREIPELAAVLSPPAPFRGLATFQEADAGDFFGREADVAEVVAALQGERPGVTVYGPSGCGKSSLALAGVVPELRRAGYEVLVIDAGRITSPAAALATELYEAVRSGRYGAARADDADRVEGRLRRLGVVDAFHRTTGRPAARLLVVLDQAEALLNRPDAELAEAVDLLFPERPAAGLRVLATLRADFMDAALSHERLGPALRRGATLPLTPMTRDQLREVITEPLKRIPAVTYDPGLDRRILDDAGSEPGILPLLGFVLAELWDRRSAGRLRTAAYEELGGVSGALVHHARKAWDACVSSGPPSGSPGSPTPSSSSGAPTPLDRKEEEAVARRLLTGLVRLLPGGEAPVRRVLTREEAGERRWRLARALAERRLLVLSGGDGQPESAELAHEALITAWPALADQVRADAGFLAGRAELRHDLERWRTAGEPTDLLPDAPHLAALEERLGGRDDELAAEERGFLTRARRRRRTRRARLRAAWVATALVLALIAGLGVFLVQERKVSAQRRAAGTSRTLAAQSEELKEGNPGQAALAALAAYEVAPTQEARSALLRRYEELRDAKWVLTGSQGDITATAMSVDGGVTLVTTAAYRATLFIRTPEGRVRQENLRLPANVVSPVVSRDGRRIAYVRGADGVVVWHEVTASADRLVGPAHPLRGALTNRSLAVQLGMSIKIMDFSPDGRRLVGIPASSSSLPTQVWDLGTGRPTPLPERAAHLTNVWFGADERTLVAVQSRTTDPKGTLVSIDIGSGTVRELAKDIDISGFGVSGDGSVAVVCHREKADPPSFGVARYQAVRVADGRALRGYSAGADTTCHDTAISRRGERYAVYTTSGGWALVDTVAQQGDPVRFSGPVSTNGMAYLPLLGTADRPVLVSSGKNGVTASAPAKDTGGTAYGLPHLLGDGSEMVVRVGADGRSLRVVATEDEWRVLAEAKVGTAATPPDKAQDLQVNKAQTLVADVSDRNRITVRSLPSLRRVAEFTTARLPAGQERPELLQFRFLDDERLVTVSGTTVEEWDARRGRRLSRPLDLRDLRLTTQDHPFYGVGRHREPGYVAVTVGGQPDVHAVDLRTGKENRDLRIRLGDELNTAVFLADSRYLAEMTKGGMVELWSAPPGSRPRRTVGPIGPLSPDQWAAGLFGRTGFFLANAAYVRFLQADDPEFRDTYEFTQKQIFLAAGDSGKALLRGGRGGDMNLLRLDPALWKRHLCEVLGRDLTEDERSGLPPGLPALCRPTA